MGDIELLSDAKYAACAVYRDVISEYDEWLREGGWTTTWFGVDRAQEHAEALEKATAAFPESLALQARREVIDMFIAAHLGAEFDDDTHEREMRRLRP